jgi:hypothetical protein
MRAWVMVKVRILDAIANDSTAAGFSISEGIIDFYFWELGVVAIGRVILVPIDSTS